MRESNVWCESLPRCPYGGLPVVIAGERERHIQPQPGAPDAEQCPRTQVAAPFDGVLLLLDECPVAAAGVFQPESQDVQVGDRIAGCDCQRGTAQPGVQAR